MWQHFSVVLECIFGLDHQGQFSLKIGHVVAYTEDAKVIGRFIDFIEVQVQIGKEFQILVTICRGQDKRLCGAHRKGHVKGFQVHIPPFFLLNAEPPFTPLVCRNLSCVYRWCKVQVKIIQFLWQKITKSTR